MMYISCDAEIGPSIQKLRPIAKDLSRSICTKVFILLDVKTDRSKVICVFNRGTEVSSEQCYEP